MQHKLAIPIAPEVVYEIGMGAILAMPMPTGIRVERLANSFEAEFPSPSKSEPPYLVGWFVLVASSDEVSREGDFIIAVQNFLRSRLAD